ncbi:MAG: ABC transporter permease [Pseudomonadota bacterium]
MSDTPIPQNARPVYNAPSARLADRFRAALGDLADGWRRRELWSALAVEDLRQRYHGTALGMAWAVLSFALFVGIFILVFGVFGDRDLKTFSVHVSAGWLVWSFISSLITGGATAFSKAGAWIAGTAMPYSTFIYRNVLIELLLAAAASLVVGGVLIAVSPPSSPVALLAFPGFALCVAFGFFAALSLAVVCLRLKDLRFVTQVVVRAAFFLTPILWQYDPTSDSFRTKLALYNPVTHFLEIVRAPLTGVAPTTLNYAVALGSTVAVAIFAISVFAAFRRRIPLWA